MTYPVSLPLLAASSLTMSPSLIFWELLPLWNSGLEGVSEGGHDDDDEGEMRTHHFSSCSWDSGSYLPGGRDLLERFEHTADRQAGRHTERLLAGFELDRDGAEVPVFLERVLDALLGSARSGGERLPE